jgi:2-amino-4-hydroxy-6-hydroxymethyldihydropteridine diphosphokinase
MGSLWMPAYVAIGSNLDSPADRVLQGFSELGRLRHSRLVLRSRLYRSAPLGPQDQPDFVNAAAGLLTSLQPHELLAALKALEASMGRERPIVRWGPRVIDFDLVVFGMQRLSAPDLTVPHPGVPERNFVLYPLLDIAPDLWVPGHGRVRELAARLGSAGLTPIT